MKRHGICSALLAVLINSSNAAPAIPHYDHIFVLVAENKSFDEMMVDPGLTPQLHRLAATYGIASRFYAEVHPSEANYIAMVAGDTFGIHDDDAFFCKANLQNEFCEKSAQPAYADHDLAARSLMDQLAENGLTWKGYMEDIPGPGSLVPQWPSAGYPVKGYPLEIYAAKHNPFVSFKSVNEKSYPWLQEHLVGFNQLYADLNSGHLPNFAMIVPNQCNEMHGRGPEDGPAVPADCLKTNRAGLIKRGDAEIGMLVDRIIGSKMWSGTGNAAIVITFDEDSGKKHEGCCGSDPNSTANFGGGRIVTIVITNNGPRHAEDATPYNHYSLLRTVEDAFGITEHLGHAADTGKGVVSMVPLFAVKPVR